MIKERYITKYSGITCILILTYLLRRTIIIDHSHENVFITSKKNI